MQGLTRSAKKGMLTTLATGLVATAVLALTAAAAHPADTVAKPADRWLKNLDGKYGQFFDSPAPNGGIMLVHIMNYFDTYNKAYGVQDKDIDAIGTFYGMTTFHGLDDAAWAKYRIGEFLKENDASGKPATANPWLREPTVLGMTLPQASIRALQKRGATFILCNNALTILSGMLAQARGLDATTVYEDLKTHILPDVELIPGMVVAIEQAHDAGLSLHRQ